MASQVERQKNLLKDCTDSIKSWKTLIETHFDDKDKNTELAALEEIVKDFTQTDLEFSKKLAACQEVADYFNEDSADHNKEVDDLYKEKLADKQEDDDYRQHAMWKEIMMGINDYDVEELSNRSQESEPTQFEEMNDSEVMYSNVFTPPVDPISKTVIKDPYKNKKCGHVYEYKFIVEYIKAMKNKAKCPYIGCSNRNINLSEIIEDKETKEKIRVYQSSQVSNE